MKKTFDCVAFQDQAAERIHSETQGMDRAEELAYWREKSKQVRSKFRKQGPKSVATPSSRPRSRGSR